MADNENGKKLWDGWAALWNGDFSVGEKIFADQCRVHWGNAIFAELPTVHDPHSLTELIRQFRSGRPNLRYHTDAGPFAGDDHITGRWVATDTRQPNVVSGVGGVDILRVVDGRIAEVWTVAGDIAIDPAPFLTSR